MIICILNLLTIPYINYYEKNTDWYYLQFIITKQIIINMIFLLDYVIMLLLFGMHEILFKRSWALRGELILQIVNISLIPSYVNVYQEDAILEEKLFLVHFIEVAILFRLLRIFSFLQELE